MKVSTKLSISFLLVVALTVIVGVVGIAGMMFINSGSREMYENQSQPLADLGMAREYFQRLRVQLRDVVLASGNIYALDIIETDLVNHEKSFIDFMEQYRQTITDPEMARLYYEIMEAFGVYQPSMQQIMASARVNAPHLQMIIMMESLTTPTDFIMDALYYLAYARVHEASFVNAVNGFWFNVLFILIIVVIAVSLIIALFLTKYGGLARFLEQSYNQLNELEQTKINLQRLESLSRMKTEYLANISHESKTPLTIISVNVQLAAELYEEEGADGKIIKEALQRAQEEILRVSRITENNLNLAAMQESREKMSEINLSKLIISSTEIRRFVTKRNGNTLMINIPDTLPHVYGNADQLIQVMDNLLTNANNHTKNGQIAIKAEAAYGHITVEVTDSGTGIPPKLLPRVFERGVTDSGGTGIGLSLCKKIINNHGGEIWAESPGQGTAVVFTLPVYNNRTVEENA